MELTGTEVKCRAVEFICGFLCQMDGEMFYWEHNCSYLRKTATITLHGAIVACFCINAKMPV